MDAAEAGPRDRHHLGGGVELHGTGAERDHGLIEGQVPAFEATHVAQQLGLGVVDVEHRVLEEGALPREALGKAATDLVIERGDVDAGPAVCEGAPHALDVGSGGGLVAGDAEAVVVDRPEVVARSLGPLLDRFGLAGRADRERVEPALVLDFETEALEPRRDDVREAMDPPRDPREPLRPVINRVHACDDAEQHLRGTDVGWSPSRAGCAARGSAARA